MCEGLHGPERKRETATLRLQLSSSAKAVGRALGEDAALALTLQQLLARVLELAQA